MTLLTVIGMFSAMVALAIIPDSSAMVVATRSISSGFKHGVVVVLGIVVVDFIFILLAVLGLSAMAEKTDSLFYVIKYLGAAYLVCMGLLLWKKKTKIAEIESVEESSWKSSFLCGLLITLGDPKAILFYMSFLPAFIDLSRLTLADIGIIMAATIVALSCTKLVYAFMADKSRLLFKSIRAKKGINIGAGSVMIATGVFLLVQA